MKATERNRQVIRQWEVLQQLEGGPKTLNELASAVGDGGVTTRTIRRDLEALEAARFPIYQEQYDDGTRRWLLLTKGVTPARLDDAERPDEVPGPSALHASTLTQAVSRRRVVRAA